MLAWVFSVNSNFIPPQLPITGFSTGSPCSSSVARREEAGDPLFRISGGLCGEHHDVDTTFRASPDPGGDIEITNLRPLQ